MQRREWQKRLEVRIFPPIRKTVISTNERARTPWRQEGCERTARVIAYQEKVETELEASVRTSAKYLGKYSTSYQSKMGKNVIKGCLNVRGKVGPIHFLYKVVEWPIFYKIVLIHLLTADYFVSRLHSRWRARASGVGSNRHLCNFWSILLLVIKIFRSVRFKHVLTRCNVVKLS